MQTDTISLNGIGLELDDPGGYLDALARAIKSIPFYSPVLRELVDDAAGRAPPAKSRAGRDTMRVLGFVNHELIATLDREWQDYANNEADRLFEYAAHHGLFASVRSVSLWGAGSCRLADYLASLPSVERVSCSDLSWPALNFGRALIEADHSDLPELLTRPRVFYHVEASSTRLIKTIKESRFKLPLTPPDRRGSIRYAVRDAFAIWDEPFTADLVVIPYLLDIFRGAQCISLLLRICQRLKAGQQIVIFTTCIAEGRAGPGRDPEAIVDALRRCGFKIRFLDLSFLPYSFSYYSYAQMHTEWNTLVVRAEKHTECDADIYVARSRQWSAIRTGQPDNADLFGSATCEAILNRIQSPENYRALAAELTPRLGEMEFENALGELLSRGLLELHADAG